MKPSKQPDEFRKRGVRTLAQGYIDNGHFASIEWLIKQHGEVIDAGFALADETLPALPDRPIYRIYSMTKPIVAMAGVILMERFRLRLFTPL
ncbi:MAG: serine hydrolase, partial [Proteobacteria bacterium]|nr:serine hydrolase [Pseudomonadota bacterium]